MSDETELVGRWLVRGEEVVGDETEQKIWDLVRNHFSRCGERESGWVVLYRDPEDGTHWELSFPQSEMHGGGPAKLTKLSPAEVKQMYPHVSVPQE